LTVTQQMRVPIARVFRMGSIGLLLIVLAGAGRAEIYQWTDAVGKLHFSDQPPAQSTAQTLRLSPMNTYTVPEILTTPGDASVAERRPRVIMYSASWCGVCKQARRYFQANRIKFTEYDVEQSAKGGREFAKLGGRGVPVILVGKRRMNGFSQTAFESLYLN